MERNETFLRQSASLRCQPVLETLNLQLSSPLHLRGKILRNDRERNASESSQEPVHSRVTQTCGDVLKNGYSKMTSPKMAGLKWRPKIDSKMRSSKRPKLSIDGKSRVTKTCGDVQERRQDKSTLVKAKLLKDRKIQVPAIFSQIWIN